MSKTSVSYVAEISIEDSMLTSWPWAWNLFQWSKGPVLAALQQSPVNRVVSHQQTPLRVLEDMAQLNIGCLLPLLNTFLCCSS